MNSAKPGYTQIVVSLALCWLSALSVAGEKFVLHTAYQNSTPKFIISEDEKGHKKASGICPDIGSAIEKHIGNDIISFSSPPVFTPIKRIYVLLETNDIDIYLCAAKTPEREKKFIFSKTPLYAIHHKVMVRKEDNVEVKDFDDIRKLDANGTLVTLFGTATARFLKSQPGLAIETPYTQIEAIHKLTQGRVRFFYYHSLGHAASIEKYNLHDKVKLLPAVFREYFHYAAFSKNIHPEALQLIESAIEALYKSGEFSRIFNRYVKPTEL